MILDVKESHKNFSNVIHCGMNTRKNKANHKAVMNIEVCNCIFSRLKNVKTMCDPYGGTGTTALSAQIYGIDCDLIDIDEIYKIEFVNEILSKYEIKE
jgi:hypothetical protein